MPGFGRADLRPDGRGRHAAGVADDRADLAFNTVGMVRNPNAMLVLDVLQRRGRLVVMGRIRADPPLSYLRPMPNGLEIIRARDAFAAALQVDAQRRADLGAM